METQQQNQSSSSSSPRATGTGSGGGGSNRQPGSQSDSNDCDEDPRAEYSCPYCYENYEIGILCSHLEDEHCYESKVAVCPICAARISKDMANHITVQHAQLFKRRRRSRRSPGTALALLSRELREANLQAVLGPPTAAAVAAAATAAAAAVASSSADSYISSLARDQDQPCNSRSSSCQRALSPEQAAMRAKFIQGLVISTLFQHRD